MSEVTVICCWNNEKMYNDFVNTLKTQLCPYELIGIDNRGNKGFTSCAAAYNSVINQVKTKYVVYSHQDILLKDSEALGKFVSYLERINSDDILGVAGVRFDTRGTFADFQHFQKNTGKFVYAGKNRLIGNIMECDTVDECFFGGHTEHFREYKFDEVTCDNWHLYAAEACLRTKSNYGLGGVGIVFICNINLVHLSNGTPDFSFIRGFCKLSEKYSRQFPFIRVTCAYSRTDKFHLALYAIRTVLRRTIINMLIKMGLYKHVYKLLKRE